MTAPAFNALTESAQWLLLSDAVQLATRENEHYTIYLFGLHAFFVEVFCHKKDYSQGFCAAFADMDKLAPYLSGISLAGLFS